VAHWTSLLKQVSNQVLGNLKTMMSGAFKALKYRKYAQTYLGAFAYRFNHRFDLRDLIARLIVDAARTKPVPKGMIRDRHAEARFQSRKSFALKLL
jgi:hypothetical protein